MKSDQGRRAGFTSIERLLVPAGAALLIAALMHGVIFGPAGSVYATGVSDMGQLFIPWRSYGFSQLRAGHIPFWTTHTFSGMPFLANAQTALLYPFNAIYLALSPIAATNWCIGVHLFAAIVLTAWWIRRRGASAAAAMFGGVAFTCSGQVMLHVYGGHLTYVCAIPWIPLTFLCMDQIVSQFVGCAWGWTLFGIFSSAMLMLCGYPQFAVCTAFIAGVYLLLRLRDSAHRLASVLMGIAMLLGGAALSAAQVLPIYAFSSVSSRSTVSTFTAASYAITPENLLTLFVPSPFGDDIARPYVGRWDYPEQSLWMGLGVLLLALVGILATDRAQRRFAVPIALVCAVAALGDHTPLFAVLYRIPAINRFRSPGRLGLFTALMLSSMAAFGVDWLLARGPGLAGPVRRRSMSPSTLAAAVAGLIAIALLVFGIAFVGDAGAGRMNAMVRWMLQFKTNHTQVDAAGIRAAAKGLAEEAFVASALAAAMGMLLLLARRSAVAASAAIALAMGQSIWFALHVSVCSSPPTQLPQPWSSYLKTQPSDARVIVLVADYENSSERFGFHDIWGYNAILLNRYTQFMAIAQGADPASADYAMELKTASPLFDLLRCRAIFSYDYQTPLIMPNPHPAIGHAALFGQVWLRHTGLDVWQALQSPEFDLSRQIILESPPHPAPEPSSDPGAVRLIDRDPQTLEITADLKTPQILLITDAYAPGWKATPIDPGPQDHYDVMPADNALRAIPLAAGHHHILLQYTAPGWIAGCWISLFALAAYLAAGFIWLRRRHVARLPQAH